MAWNKDKTYMYLYRGSEPDFLRVLRSGGAEDIRDVEVSESLSYAISQLQKTPGRVIWQMRIPMDTWIRLTTARFAQKHDHNQHINWVIRRDWLSQNVDKSVGALIRPLDITDTNAALDLDQATFEP